MKGRQLAATLRGKAREIHRSISKNDQHNFDELVKSLNSRFSDTTFSNVARSRFHSAKRGRDENVSDFINRLRGFLVDAYPTLPKEKVEDFSQQSFMDSQSYVSICEHVICHHVAELHCGFC